jgi:LPS export ABC transporter protein LptC
MAVPVYTRPLLALLATAVIVIFAAVVFQNGSHGSQPERSVVQPLPTNIDVALKDARFSEIQDGHVVWELAAGRVDYDKTGEVAYLANIVLLFKRPAPRGTITVTADRGEYDAGKKMIHLMGRVHAEMDDNARFKTASLVYSGVSERFSTDDSVNFQQHRLQMTAVGMDLGVKDQQARFRSSVDAVLAIPR